MEDQQVADTPKDKPSEEAQGASTAPQEQHQQQDEGTSTANAQGAEDSGYIASYTAQDPPASQGATTEPLEQARR